MTDITIEPRGLPKKTIEELEGENRMLRLQIEAMTKMMRAMQSEKVAMYMAVVRAMDDVANTAFPTV